MNISPIQFRQVQTPQTLTRTTSNESFPRQSEPTDRWEPSNEEASAGSRSADLSSSLLSGFGFGISEEEKLKRDLVNFEDRLPTAAKETYRGLDQQKKIDVMRLGKVFPGSTIGDSPLIKLMQDGRLFEKDSSGATPLERVTEAAQPDRPDFSSKGNFVYRALKAIENPGQSRDAKGKSQSEASVNPADFIRKAGEEYNHQIGYGDTLTMGR